MASGDPEAVNACLQRFGGLVWSLARRMLGAGPDAEDAVQEIFIELWRVAGRFDNTKGGEDQFVAMIARRRLIDKVRQRTRRPQPETLPETLALEAPENSSAELADEAGRAMDALQTLRPEVRRVIEMAVLGGHSHSQVASATGLPLGTVKSHVRRGLEAVRRNLGADSGGAS